MREIFWEQTECFMRAQGHLLTEFRMGLLGERADLHATAIREKGAPLPHCVEFIDCTKISICRPGGDGRCSGVCTQDTNESTTWNIRLSIQRMV